MPDELQTSGEDDHADYLIEARNISKQFGSTLANNCVNIAIKPGEIHALLGENGAGKSTLVKILYGALKASSGTLFWKGKPAEVSSPSAARKLGIGMVFQHFSLFDSLSVTENIALALPKGFKKKQLAEQIARVSHSYGLPLDPHALVADLPVGVRQRIEIVRCLLQNPDLIIMDEPTSVLTPQEAEQLFVTLKRLTDEGCSILYISHRLEEVQLICHNATIMRHGKVVHSCDPSKETAASLAQMMVGGEVHSITSHRQTATSKTLLEIDALSLEGSGPFSVSLKNISLQVQGGEVVAIAGIAGNGQGELFDVLSGETRLKDSYAIKYLGVPCGRRRVNARRRLGAAFVPEERLGHGAVPDMSLTENVLLTRHRSGDALVSAGMVNKSLCHALEARIIDEYDVRMAHPGSEAGALSGGNLQKFIVGRELDRRPRVMVINQPTWGVDAGAAALIRQSIIDLARSGAAVVVISQDLDEIYEVADRISVISRGQLSKAEPVATISREKIGLLMAGMAENQQDNEGPYAA